MQDTPSPIDLSGLAQSLYAQGSEEGILSRVMERIAPAHRFCVDIGASDGLRNSNTALLLRERGWQGLLVEASRYRYEKLEANYGGAQCVRLRHERVQPDTVDQLLATAGVPQEPDLLSIDIDGNDYWVWRGLQAFQPRIVVIEYNPYYTPPERWVMCFNPDHEWDGSTYYGASLASLHRLGQSKGYELVCCDDMGNNAFFVRRDLYPLLGIANNDPSVLFRPAMYKLRYVGHNTFVSGHPYRHGPAEHI
ncbi:FkbM family methyltransferase [Paraburkholderia sp. B3]|uniref:FkbM family methyltransferase n=1 Tax=Paraburkholderia sp. B3 TaxID=3134791 RepID=UPI003982A64F